MIATEAARVIGRTRSSAAADLVRVRPSRLLRCRETVLPRHNSYQRAHSPLVRHPGKLIEVSRVSRP
jgi:hypothetical protein